MNYYTNIFSIGDTLLCRKVVNGKRVKERVKDFHPRLWVPAKSKEAVTGWTTIHGYPVEEIDAGGIRAAYGFIKQNRDVDNFSVYGNIQPQYQYIAQEYPGEIHSDLSKINVCYIDIETGPSPSGGFASADVADGVIRSISLRFTNTDCMITFGLKDYTPKNKSEIYIQSSTEQVMLERFLELWKKNTPDIITGWNNKFFDIPYLINRLTRVLGEEEAKKLSPWKNIKAREEFDNNRKQNYYEIAGISILDYMLLYKKFTYKIRESYSLNFIASVELGEKKIDYSEFASLNELYEKDFQKYIEYNIHDVDLLIMLENKLKLLELAVILAHRAKVNFEDVFSQGRLWDAIIYNYLLTLGQVIPEKKDNSTTIIEGAYVKDPIPGFKTWVASVDLASLYPHLIMQFGISPENLVDGKRVDVTVDDLVNKSFDTTFLKEKNLCMAANGQLFRREQRGFLGDLMQHMFDQRKLYKKKMIDEQIYYETILNECKRRNLKF